MGLFRQAAMVNGDGDLSSDSAAEVTSEEEEKCIGLLDYLVIFAP